MAYVSSFHVLPQIAILHNHTHDKHNTHVQKASRRTPPRCSEADIVCKQVQASSKQASLAFRNVTRYGENTLCLAILLRARPGISCPATSDSDNAVRNVTSRRAESCPCVSTSNMHETRAANFTTSEYMYVRKENAREIQRCQHQNPSRVHDQHSEYAGITIALSEWYNHTRHTKLRCSNANYYVSSCIHPSTTGAFGQA